MTSIIYLQTILRSFTTLDIDGLRLYLKDEYTYQEVTKDVFLDKLDAVFEKHRAAGDTELLLYPGACAGETCPNCGKRGYRFVGNQSNNYIDLLFETEGDNITDIYSCSQFRSDTELPNLLIKSFIDVDLDEKASFPKTTAYWTKVYAAQDAYNEMITNPPRKLRFDEIESWLAEHADLYQRLGGFKFVGPNVKWTPFLHLYYNFKEMTGIISENLDKIRQANREYNEKWTEQKLINWIISYEEIFHTGTLELKYFLVKKGEDYGIAEFDKYLFTGEVFAEAYAFFDTIEENYSRLIYKYTIFSGDEEDEIVGQDDWKIKIHERVLLRFHLQKRKELEELGIVLPYYLFKNKDSIPF